MDVEVRRAEDRDLEAIRSLLRQVCQVHADGRPDLFKAGGIKYTDGELREILRDDSRPVYVAADGAGRVLGYVFCVLEETPETTALRPVKTLYIDDLCVDSAARGRRIGRTLYEFALAKAAESGCSRVTLHAWHLNGNAFAFYEKLGMKPLYTTLEQRL